MPSGTLNLGSIELRPVWADSLGAKSFCTLIRTPDVSIVVDPGVAIMHPSFPAPWEMKERWLVEGYDAISEAVVEADVVVITHYHYDHYTDFEESFYRGRLILAKSPNEYINDSQRERALHFFSNLFSMEGLELDEVMEGPADLEIRNPLDEIPHAMSLDYADYTDRKRELLDKGMRWFSKRVERWRGYSRIPEHDGETFRLRFADGREFSFGGTRVRFTRPMFHGVEFSRVGWVVGLVVESAGEKVLYTSDVNGPIIEDYADWIVGEGPEVALIDGPATYTLGYMLNRINLRRAIENLTRIVREAGSDVILLDHHLPREPRFRERLRKVYELAERERVRVITVAEHYGKVPAVLSHAWK